MIVHRRTWFYRLAGQKFAHAISFKIPLTANQVREKSVERLAQHRLNSGHARRIANDRATDSGSGILRHNRGVYCRTSRRFSGTKNSPLLRNGLISKPPRRV